MNFDESRGKSVGRVPLWSSCSLLLLTAAESSNVASPEAQSRREIRHRMIFASSIAPFTSQSFAQSEIKKKRKKRKKKKKKKVEKKCQFYEGHSGCLLMLDRQDRRTACHHIKTEMKDDDYYTIRIRREKNEMVECSEMVEQPETSKRNCPEASPSMQNQLSTMDDNIFLFSIWWFKFMCLSLLLDHIWLSEMSTDCSNDKKSPAMEKRETSSLDSFICSVLGVRI